MNPFLDVQERTELERLLTHPETLVQRTAKLLLLADQGLTGRQIGVEVALTRSGVYYWVRRFRKVRFGIFHSDLGKINQNQPLLVVENPVIISSAPGEQPSKTKTKSEKDDFPLPQPFRNPGVLPEDDFAEAGRKIWLYHFAQMLSKEAGTIKGEDVEALHDMRVATRRMRAAFDVFGNAFKPKFIQPFLKGLKATGRALGRVRDMDVFLEKITHYLGTLPSEKRFGLESLLQSKEEQRAKDRIIMVAHLESPEYVEFRRKFNNFLQTPGAGARAFPELSASFDRNSPQPGKVSQIVPLLIYSRLAAVSAYEPILPNATIPQLHALRIEFKRLRYTLEFFSEVLGNQAIMAIEEIKRLQDHLGDLHDADIACHILGKIVEDWENQHTHIQLAERPNPAPVIAYLAFCAEERHRLLVSFPAAWVKFHRQEVKHNLALSMAGSDIPFTTTEDN